MEGPTIYQRTARKIIVFICMYVSVPKILRARNLDDFRLAQLHGVVSGHFTNVQEKFLSW